MTVVALTAEQDQLLDRWTAMALQRMPYFSTLLLALRPVNCPGMGTFGVDPWFRLYIDFGAVAQRGDLWCAEALLHECGHLFMEHASRAVDLGLVKDGKFTDALVAKRSNIAADCEINDDLAEAGCTTLAEGGVLPARLGLPDHETYEFYYRRMPTSPPQEGGSGGDLVTVDSGCGSGAGAAPLSVELPKSESLGGDAPAATDAEIESTMVSVAAEVRQAARSRGTVPGGLTQQAEALLAPPKVRWQDVLRTTMNRASATRSGDSDTTYTRINRRRHNQRFGTRKVRFAGTYSPIPTGVLVRDTSGSMSNEDLTSVTNETVGIANALGISGSDFQIIDVDAAVHSVRGFTGAAAMATVAGRGGTDMRVGIDRALECRPRPAFVVVATDGYTPWPEERIKGTTIIACLVGTAESVEHARPEVPTWIKVVAAVGN